MALAATTVWEVRTAGSDTACSGGFVAGGGGTDYSQQNAAQYNNTDLVIDGAVNTLVSSATHNFVAADVGNLLRITAGSGFTTGFFQIVSVSANKATLDRSAGTLGSTAGTYYVGGALATPGLAVGAAVGGNTVYAKGGYTSTSDSANVAGGYINWAPAGGSQTVWSRFIGYTTTRGDGGKYVMTHGATFTNALLQCGNSTAWNEFRNIEIVGNAAVASKAIYLVGRSNRIFNVKVSGYTANTGNHMVEVGNLATIKDFEISGGTTGSLAALIVSGAGSSIQDGWVHGNAGVGVAITGNGDNIERVMSAEHTGANGKAFYITGQAEFKFFECVGWNNAAGDFLLGNANGSMVLTRCVSGGGGAYNFDNQSGPDAIALYYCAAKANSTGLYPVTPNTNVGLVTLTGDPFTNRTAGDFSPDATAGEGAALRGVLETIFGLTTTYADVGPAQHQDSAVAPVSYIRQVAMRGGGG